MTTNTTHAYFDLHDYIRSIQSVDVAAQMAQSVAFSIDVAIANAARQLLKNLQATHLDHGIDSFSEMSVALRDSAFAEQVMSEAGQALGPVATIQALNPLRDQWQQLAGELTSMTCDYRGIPRTYEIKPIEDLLTREVKLQVKPLTARRIRMQVERRADGADINDIDKVVEKRMAREEQKVKDISRVLTEQQGAIVTLYHLASTIDMDVEISTEFHTLDANLRMQCINAALKGCERAEDFAASSSNITDSEFDQISFAVLKIERELKAVLQSPAYKVAEHIAAI